MELSISIVIPTYNRKAKLANLLRSIYSSHFPQEKMEVIVVDNQSTDGTEIMVRQEFARIEYIRNSANTKSGGGRNVGAEIAKGEFVFFIDDDNILDPECVGRMVEYAERNPNVGVLAPLMMRADGETIWCAGGRLNSIGMPITLYSGKKISDVLLPDVITGLEWFPNAYMVRTSIMRNGIMHDSVNFPHNWAETDFCQRVIKVGYELETLTTAITKHDLGYNRRITRIGIDNTYDQARSRILFRRKYRNFLGQWLAFWAIIFPISSVYYLSAFIQQDKEKTLDLIKVYIKGTIDGLRPRPI